jgi:hypothetical protein
VVSPCKHNNEVITILHYSNPDVDYKNKATGTSSTNNNAKVIRDATCRVSDYVQSNDVNVHFIHPYKVCPGDNFTLTGSVTGDYGPYTYQWRYKIGYNGQWSNIITPTPQNQLSLTAPTGGFYGVIYVELTGTNGTDQATYSSGIVVDYFCDNRPASATSPSHLKEGKAISVFPNPATNHLGILLKEAVSGDVNVVVSNALGKQYFSKTVSLGDAPVNQFEVVLPNLADGQYTLTVRPATGLPQVAQFSVFK